MCDEITGYIFIYLLHECLCALVLNVSLCRGEKSADSVHVDAALDEAAASALQFVQSVVVSSVHHAYQEIKDLWPMSLNYH